MRRRIASSRCRYTLRISPRATASTTALRVIGVCVTTKVLAFDPRSKPGTDRRGACCNLIALSGIPKDHGFALDTIAAMRSMKSMLRFGVSKDEEAWRKTPRSGDADNDGGKFHPLSKRSVVAGDQPGSQTEVVE